MAEVITKEPQITETPELEYIPVDPEHVTIANSAGAELDAAIKHVIESGYGKKEGDSIGVGALLDRVRAWSQETDRIMNDRDMRLTDLRSRLAQLFDVYDSFFTSFSDLLYLEEHRLDESDLDFVISGAVFNQRLAADYYRSLTLGKSQRTGLDQFNAIIKSLAPSAKDQNKMAAQLEMKVSGARVQAGLMKLITDNGGIVLVPDPENEDEIKKWDVEGKTDMVVIAPDGTIFTIDIKGKKNIQLGTDRYTQNKDVSIQQGSNDTNRHLPDIVSEAISTIDEARKATDSTTPEGRTKVVQMLRAKARFTGMKEKPVTAKVVIPTGAAFLGPNGEILNREHVQELLSFFKLTQPETD